MGQFNKLKASGLPRLSWTAGRATLAAVLVLAPTGVLAQSAGPAPEQSQPAAGQGSADQSAPGSTSEDFEAGKVPVPAPPPDAALPTLEPVISNQEFNKTVPELSPQDDPELDKPLESITDFENRVANEQSGTTTTAAQTVESPAAGTATPQPVEIGNAPVRDAELSAPLPPIDSYDVTPVEIAADNSDNAAPEITYATRIEGLDVADKEASTDLASEFRSLSALRKGHGKAANAAMVAARLTEDVDLMKTILSSEGWYSPQVRSRIVQGDQNAGANKAVTALIEVTPGTRYTFSDIVIQADPTVPPNLIRDNLALDAGQPIIAERVQGAEANVAVALPENGYAFAKVGDRDILLDRETGGGVYTLPVDVGPRSRFDGFTTSGKLAFSADHVATLARFKRGELYKASKVDDLRKALVATSLFSTVTVEPKKTGQKADDGTEYVNLSVVQNAGPPRTVAGSLGYAAGEGIKAQATWTHRNMFPPEGALIAAATAGTREQGAGVTFRRSNAGKRDRTFEVVAEAYHNNYDAYSAYTGRIAAHVSRDSTPIWQKKFTYAYGVELLATAETDYEPALNDRVRHTYYVAGVSGQVGFDQSDSLLDPTKGYRLTALVQPEATVNGGFNPYVRARIDASAYYPVNDSLVIAGRVRLGTIQGAGLYGIAPSRRLYAGGGGSVRGYAYQALGEQAADGKPVGGRSLNEASVEARYRFGNYGVVAFVDAGQAYRATTPQFKDLRYGVGIGGRFYTNFGPVRLDVATPIARRPGESRINVYVSIGQAF